ncbi:MAG: Ppx/GppA phosphatase family protein [Ilumatobacteraceae bacterium]|nr:Ppx/GppA family phosphatase [Acidimicrobiales bacterium]MCB9395034.1 Ppx/GppA family phosphatase [Acidimicrobiaceae bacterium]
MTSDPGAVAALDLGTNSFHLVVARRRGAGVEAGYEIVTREKQTIRLGHGGGDMKTLSDDAIERGVQSLRRMKQIADSHGAAVRAVATSAVREAENAEVFIVRARREAGIEVEVISGVEEARLIHLGVLQSVPAFDQRLLLCDIGGGSTEVLVGERGATLAARSFKLGAVRLTDRFFPGGMCTPRAVAACRSYVRSILAGFERDVAQHGFEVAIASSGTAETVATMVATSRLRTLPQTLNRFEFSRADVERVVHDLVAKRTPDARATLPGLEAGRADIVVAGALVLQCVAEAFDVATFTFSEGALREGVLLDTIARNADHGELHHLRDVAEQSVRALAERCDDDVAHSAHVADLALQLFDATASMHRLPAAARRHLAAAAMLANVGLVVAHSKHHLHSYYVIRHSELAGLTDHEIELIALIARYHRKSAPKPSHPEFQALDPEAKHVVRVLAGILRVAIGLDRSHDGRVRAVRAHRQAKRLLIDAVHRPDVDVGLEVYTAHERSGLLAQVLSCHIDVVGVPDAAI